MAFWRFSSPAKIWLAWFCFSFLCSKKYNHVNLHLPFAIFDYSSGVIYRILVKLRSNGFENWSVKYSKGRRSKATQWTWFDFLNSIRICCSLQRDEIIAHGAYRQGRSSYRFFATCTR
jgi:hypothetical protein